MKIRTSLNKVSFTVLMTLFIISCNKVDKGVSISREQLSEIEQDILKVNRYILKKNRDHIHGFIHRTGWEMRETGSGLYIMFTNEGNGALPVKGNTVILDYKMMLIDGTLLSSSEKDGVLEVTIGSGELINGLEEAISLMRSGSIVRIIVPPYLAYGNFGDREKGIPPDAILLYELKLRKIH